MIIGVLAAASAQAAQPGPLLSCKAAAQQTCGPSGCEAQEPVTEAELDVDLRIGGKPSFCYGTACWRTGWSRLDRAKPDQLVVSLSAQTSFNGKPERLWLQAAVALRSLGFQASVADGSGAIQVFSGTCVCRTMPSKNAGCPAHTSRGVSEQ